MTEMAKAYGHMSDVLGGPQGYDAPEQALFQSMWTDVWQTSSIHDAPRQHIRETG